MNFKTFYFTISRSLMIWIVSFGFIAAAFAEDPAPAGDAAAGQEFVCRADVFYSWKRKPAPSADAKSAQPTVEPIEEFYSTVEVRSPDEAAGKATLAQKLTATQPQAMRECAKRHQNTSACKSYRLESLGGDFALMDFAARRTVLDSINEDCLNDAGICISVRNGDPQCEKQAAAADAGKADAAADDKKKKK